MEININYTKQILEKLLGNQMSREEASFLAYDLRQKADDNKLMYFPKANENMIWESILFIEGIDIQNEPNVYLYNERDIAEFLQKLKCFE